MIDDLIGGLGNIDEATQIPVAGELVPRDQDWAALGLLLGPIGGGVGTPGSPIIFPPYVPLYPIGPGPVILPPIGPITPPPPIGPPNPPITPPVAPAALPEPGSWVTMLIGFGLIGASARSRRSRPARS